MFEDRRWDADGFFEILDACKEINVIFHSTTILTEDEATVIKLRCPFVQFTPVPEQKPDEI